MLLLLDELAFAPESLAGGDDLPAEVRLRDCPFLRVGRAPPVRYHRPLHLGLDPGGRSPGGLARRPPPSSSRSPSPTPASSTSPRRPSARSPPGRLREPARQGAGPALHRAPGPRVSYPIFGRITAARRRFWWRMARRGRLVRTSRSSCTRTRWAAAAGSARRYTRYSPKLLDRVPEAAGRHEPRAVQDRPEVEVVVVEVPGILRRRGTHIEVGDQPPAGPERGVQAGHHVGQVGNQDERVERGDDVVPAGAELLVVEVDEPGSRPPARQPEAGEVQQRRGNVGQWSSRTRPGRTPDWSPRPRSRSQDEPGHGPASRWPAAPARWSADRSPRPAGRRTTAGRTPTTASPGRSPSSRLCWTGRRLTIP